MYEFVWQDSEEATTATGTRTGGLERPTRLVLKYAGHELSLDSRDRPALLLGRDAGCDVVIPDPAGPRDGTRASRPAAKVRPDRPERQRHLRQDRRRRGDRPATRGTDPVRARLDHARTPGRQRGRQAARGFDCLLTPAIRSARCYNQRPASHGRDPIRRSPEEPACR